jgi:hypothetical protein
MQFPMQRYNCFHFKDKLIAVIEIFEYVTLTHVTDLYVAIERGGSGGKCQGFLWVFLPPNGKFLFRGLGGGVRY